MCSSLGGEQSVELEQGVRSCYPLEVCAGWVGAMEGVGTVSSPVLKQRGRKVPKSKCKHFILTEGFLCCFGSQNVLSRKWESRPVSVCVAW